MSEIWKAIPGYEGFYEVSDQGRVRSLGRVIVGRNGKKYKCCCRVLQQHFDRYYSVELWIRGSRKRINVHRLVAMAFVPNPKGYNVVNHKDEDSKNNKVENLEWCTTKYNLNYGTARERRGRKRWVAVIATDKDGNEYRFESMAEAAEKTGAGFRNIGMCCQGAKGRSTAGGYRWRYARNE